MNAYMTAHFFIFENDECIYECMKFYFCNFLNDDVKNVYINT